MVTLARVTPVAEEGERAFEDMVAPLLAEFSGHRPEDDTTTIVAALLHDAVEDTGLTLESISESFGPGVAKVVDGVTKLDRLQFDSKEAQQAATIRKMLVAM